MIGLISVSLSVSQAFIRNAGRGVENASTRDTTAEASRTIGGPPHPVPTSIDSEADFEIGRSTEHQDWTNTTFEEPTASRKALARRLRAVFSVISE